jgi:hypothetical protein
MDPRARVGDADREETVAALQRYASEGYLSLDEFSDRSAAAFRATTYGELAAVTEDLARASSNRSPAGRATGSISWTPVAIAVAVVVGLVVVAAVVMVLMMLGMMGGMGGMR